METTNAVKVSSSDVKAILAQLLEQMGTSEFLYEVREAVGAIAEPNAEEDSSEFDAYVAIDGLDAVLADLGT